MVSNQNEKVSIHIHVYFGGKRGLQKVKSFSRIIFSQKYGKWLGFIILLKLREIRQFDTYKIFRIDSKTNTTLVKEVFGFLVTVMTSELVLCNSQPMKEAEMALVTFCSILILFQSNDVWAVCDVVR